MKKLILIIFVMLRQNFFCWHRWKFHSSNRYNINRGDGTKEGEVTLTLFECEKCCKDKLVPSNRVYNKKPLADNNPNNHFNNVDNL